MSRTSRCFARISLKLGGPDALLGVERILFSHLADSYFTLATRRLSRKIFGITSWCGTLLSADELIFHATGKSASAHNQGGK
jgi:hypothetical protein